MDDLTNKKIMLKIRKDGINGGEIGLVLGECACPFVKGWQVKFPRKEIVLEKSHLGIVYVLVDEGADARPENQKEEVHHEN